jgi:glutamate racemase
MKPNYLASSPIGVFDSGIGGLTLVQALTKYLPHENLIYFGDTAHLPYGDKSAITIQAYAIKIAHLLLERKCKLILIGCYSATAAAFELIKEYVGSQAIVMNVIDPTIRLLKEKYSGKRIGLIGTKQTVHSNIHQKKIDQFNIPLTLSSYPTSLLASAIEEFGNHPIIDALLKIYLAHPNLQSIDALVLACTHYPVIKEKIADYYNHKIDIIDASDIVALTVKQQLEKLSLLNVEGTNQKHFYVSDYTASFETHASLFFKGDIQLEHYPLWD